MFHGNSEAGSNGAVVLARVTAGVVEEGRGKKEAKCIGSKGGCHVTGSIGTIRHSLSQSVREREDNNKKWKCSQSQSRVFGYFSIAISSSSSSTE